MEVTRRFWAVLGVVAVVLGGGAVLDAPLLLAGATLVLAWLIGVQAVFLRELAAVDAEVTYDLTTETTRPRIDEPMSVVLTVEGPGTTALDRSVTVALPVAATGDPIHTAVNGQETAATTTLSWATAGRFQVGPPRLTATDPFGLFVEHIERGPTIEVTPRPRRPETIHLGQGGDRVAAAYGEHTTDGTGPGIEPAELREYQPGDEIRQIDWKATARLNEPHVMESTAETDRRTVLHVDQREPMAIGPDGATQFDYARAAALAIAGSARDLGDPLGLFAIGDEGLTTAQPPESSPGVYDRIDSALRGARPTATKTERLVDPEQGPADAHRLATQLGGANGDQFSGRLVPLLENASPYVQRIEDKPLFSTARTHVGSLQGTTWTVIVTDDSGRAELKETVDLARRGNGRVLAIITPRCLFEADGLTDVDAAYEAYTEFESFRRDLAALDRVEAFELAPGDRLATVLGAGGHRT